MGYIFLSCIANILETLSFFLMLPRVVFSTSHHRERSFVLNINKSMVKIILLTCISAPKLIVIEREMFTQEARSSAWLRWDILLNRSPASKPMVKIVSPAPKLMVIVREMLSTLELSSAWLRWGILLNRRQRGTSTDSPKLIVGSEVRVPTPQS